MISASSLAARWAAKLVFPQAVGPSIVIIGNLVELDGAVVVVGWLVEKVVESEFRRVALRRFPPHEIGGILVVFVFADVAPQEENHLADEVLFGHVAVDEERAHLLVLRIGEIADHGVGAFQEIQPAVLFSADGDGDGGRLRIIVVDREILPFPTAFEGGVEREERLVRRVHGGEDGEVRREA